MENQPSTLHMLLVYLGLRHEGAIPADEPEVRSALRLRRVLALGLLLFAIVAIADYALRFT